MKELKKIFILFTLYQLIIILLVGFLELLNANFKIEDIGRIFIGSNIIFCFSVILVGLIKVAEILIRKIDK